MEKQKKIYEKPLLQEIRLEVGEAVLTNCKSSKTAKDGKANQGCAHKQCKGNKFGS